MIFRDLPKSPFPCLSVIFRDFPWHGNGVFPVLMAHILQGNAAKVHFSKEIVTQPIFGTGKKASPDPFFPYGRPVLGRQSGGGEFSGGIAH